ncbi:hypothetical protein KAFR_0B03230 [Kazachstania africana CBS 2517]|uniref:Pre-mRNA-splicing factor CEF1 n=1 Tax=Kazachstania africana (strain ATCC 22294 / BCRC 22015 / CBS 2517 / CECT 1963 / NBRC 1671 / NRRL Y-8276) TaxID=1071382 RepID=H2AQG9_KAZAF|nr:hypothetical protein KAFR_0B03230 [Kazachstania africana CBS 2517]CCF56619.1 hypothetical protein KAFR_0B03230 [Kazachstania africana CBS 2517]
MAPVPVYVKGGVWSNVEDQILKAAIQKYGTHQWSKIASLLHKKSARQCEIRWNEFLNPQLNFSEFSKEDDSRLLDLARKLPNQWRTISGIMGRTAQVCINRYNRLLSSEEAITDNEAVLGSSLEYKVGDLNPNVDTQAALPDKDELEDDEREMLAEAKARLLNTQGKKASRKVRERMLEESKRIAQLQKRRELKQAGISTKIKRANKKYTDEIDYNEDIIYEQVPLHGIYDTKEEDERTQNELDEFHALVRKRGLHEKDQRRETVRLPEKKGKYQGKKRNREEAEVGDTIQRGGKSVEYDTFRVASGFKLSAPGSTTENTLGNEKDISSKRRKLLETRNVGTLLHKDKLTSLSHNVEQEIEQNNEQFLEAVKRRQLAQLFVTLPPPKNDFEILLEDEEEENASDIENGEIKEKEEANKTDKYIESGEEVDLLESQISEEKSLKKLRTLNLESLNMNELPTPDFIENPNTLFEETYNELLSNGITGVAYEVSDDVLSCYDAVDKALNTITVPISTETNSAIVELPSRAVLGSSITSQKLRVQSLQKELNFVKPLKEQNALFSEQLCGNSIPQLSSLVSKYYIDYKIYQNELYGLKLRKANLQEQLKLITNNLDTR